MFSNPVTWPVLQIPVGLSIGEIGALESLFFLLTASWKRFQFQKSPPPTKDMSQTISHIVKLSNYHQKTSTTSTYFGLMFF